MHGETKLQITQRVLALVRRAREALASLGPASVDATGVLLHPATQLAALKAAREHLNKAIAMMEQTRWTK